VLARFGADGRRFHDLARGLDAGPPVLVTAPPDLVEQTELDPPSRASTRSRSQRRPSRAAAVPLAERGLACTRVVIEAETEHGERLARCWRHDRVLTPAALAERVRWQLDGWLVGRIEEDEELDTTTVASRCCASSPTKSCPPTAGSSASGVATKPRTTVPTVRSRACRPARLRRGHDRGRAGRSHRGRADPMGSVG
jgi:hypothetical protein